MHCKDPMVGEVHRTHPQGLIQATKSTLLKSSGMTIAFGGRSSHSAFRVSIFCQAKICQHTERHIMTWRMTYDAWWFLSVLMTIIRCCVLYTIGRPKAIRRLHGTESFDTRYKRYRWSVSSHLNLSSLSPNSSLSSSIWHGHFQNSLRPCFRIDCVCDARYVPNDASMTQSVQGSFRWKQLPWTMFIPSSTVKATVFRKLAHFLTNVKTPVPQTLIKCVSRSACRQT